jgi:hypothetical protein
MPRCATPCPHTLVAAGVAFKATAGLHHAVCNTDPSTGFEQHGFLNVMTAVDAATRHPSLDDLVAMLANRDGAALAGGLSAHTEDEGAQARSRFLSMGTCSILEPMADLVELGLIPASDLYDAVEGKPA